MGKLIKNHLARLLILTASAYQTLASIYAFFWPKLFFDFLTTNLDGCVRPIPILQIINLLLGLLGIAWEWPLPAFTRATKVAGKGYATTNNNNNKNINKSKGEGRPQRDIDGGRTAHTTKAGTAANATATPREQHGQDGAGPMTTFLAGMHRSIEARLMLYPLSCLASFLLYQATNAALYYVVGMAVYFWAFSEGEVVMGVPWTLPRRGRARAGLGNV